MGHGVDFGSSVHRTIAALLLMSVSVPAGAQIASSYRALALGEPSGATSYSVSRMSSDGRWVAGTAAFADGSRAVVWHDSIPFVIPRIGGSSGAAADVNSSGLVVGQSNGRAFAYQAGTLTELNANPSWPSNATAVNDAGVIVGQSGGWGGFNDQYRAVSWASPAAAQFDVHGAAGLPNGVASTGSSGALDIFGNGTVGGFIVPNTYVGGFVYNSGGGSWYGVAYGSDGFIRSFNADDGTGIRYVVGDGLQRTRRYIYQWSASETAAGIINGTGSGRSTDMVPLAVTANGTYIGYTENNDAWIGTFDVSTEVRLDTLLESGSLVDLTGAVDIANDGIILANGYDSTGYHRGYLLTPIPAPGSIAALAVCGAVIAVRRKR
jgi:hypothetical protein